MKKLADQFEKTRLSYQPKTPKILNSLVGFATGIATTSVSDQKEIEKLFPLTYGRPLLHIDKNATVEKKPLKVGVVFSGGQAAGGHNVIAGLFDALKEFDDKSVLIGFLNGPGGIVENKSIEITAELLSSYRNIGGFDLIGSGRTKIETDQQLDLSAKTVSAHKLDGLVVVGGDDSNTNAALLAEYLLLKEISTKVIGVPKTIDGDLQNDYIEISFGFDTACKTYSEMIGNICRDSFSAKKYYHFVKLMGRSASHITLECALQTQPNITLIAEEVQKHNRTLMDVTVQIADVVVKRSKDNKEYGVVLIPEGLIEFFPDMKNLIAELNNVLANQPSSEEFDHMSLEEKLTMINSNLSKDARHTLESMPAIIQEQLLLDRDPHGNVQVSMIQTERLLSLMVQKELKRRKEKGEYNGSFKTITHFFGYEGRSGYPSNFDANYCYSLGRLSLMLIAGGFTGYMSCIHNLSAAVEDWGVLGLPITMMMNIEVRAGKHKSVIKKSLVDLEGPSYQYFIKNHDKWAFDDCYCNPGPIQFSTDSDISDTIPLTVSMRG